MAFITLKERRVLLSHLVGFFVLALIMGIIEDILAIYFATDDPITWHTLKVAFFVAFPFSILGVIVADYQLLRRILGKTKKKKS